MGKTVVVLPRPYLGKSGIVEVASGSRVRVIIHNVGIFTGVFRKANSKLFTIVKASMVGQCYPPHLIDCTSYAVKKVHVFRIEDISSVDVLDCIA